MNYYEELKAARKDCESLFFAQDEDYLKLISLVRKALPKAILSIENECHIDKYKQALLASFIRTSFVSIELIINSELIEAITLLRKQIELIARLRELDQFEHEELKKKNKPPNVKYLKTHLKKLYSPYSDGAHSTTYASHSLLGFYEDTEKKRHIMCPEFTKNTEVIFDNWLWVFFEFTLWVLEYKVEHAEGYSQEADEAEYEKIFLIYKNSSIKGKFVGKHGN